MLEYIEFIAKSRNPNVSDQADKLLELKDFEVKTNLVEWILSKKPAPVKMQRKSKFNNMTVEHLEKFKTCALTQNVITFAIDQVFEEERQKVIELAGKNFAPSEITQTLLIS